MKKQSIVVDANTLIKKIREYQKTTKCSLFALATNSNLHRNTLRSLHDPKWNPSSETLNAVIKFIDSPAS